ncbi:MAG: MucR family transcriptional regulator [Candidatus Sphingomonas phytovorans]|nr:MucR family transcriptional regulator [Sphingomonas sp.]WEK00632.1 MAG: MucR family transcriptional regulator [Sphingomonas sp.]
MATASIIANDDTPAIAGEILLLPVDQIDIGERLRPIDEVWALALGGIMAKEGQQTPIEVCQLPGKPGYRLVAGAHRHTGARLVGMELIEARIVSASAAHRKMREISENLWRRDLDPIDRAAFIAELVTLHKVKAGIDLTKDGRSASANARWKQDVKAEAADANVTMTFAYGWAEDVAEQLGFSRSKVERDLLLYRRLAPSLIARLREARHPMATNAAQLRALTKLDAEKQGEAVDLVLGGWNGKVGDAIAKVTGTNRAVRTEDKLHDRVLGSFKRLGVAEKKGVLAGLKSLLPAGYRLFEDGEEAPASADAVDPRPALEVAFKVLAALVDGDVVEDEEIAEACGLVQEALGVAEAVAPAPEPVAAPVPAVAIRASVKPDYLVCLECGEKHEQLTRHLSSKHQLSKADYLQKWKLPVDYPFTAPNLAYNRAQAARKLGLKSGAKSGEAK